MSTDWQKRLGTLLGGAVLALAFVPQLHGYAQALTMFGGTIFGAFGVKRPGDVSADAGKQVTT